MISTSREALIYLINLSEHNLEGFVRGVAGPRHVCGRAMDLLPVVDELYLTVHKPTESDKHSFRLWLKRPEQSTSGHPDWSHAYAVSEVWADNQQINEAIGLFFPECSREVLTELGSWFCEEMTIIKIK